MSHVSNTRLADSFHLACANLKKYIIHINLFDLLMLTAIVQICLLTLFLSRDELRFHLVHSAGAASRWLKGHVVPRWMKKKAFFCEQKAPSVSLITCTLFLHRKKKCSFSVDHGLIIPTHKRHGLLLVTVTVWTCYCYCDLTVMSCPRWNDLALLWIANVLRRIKCTYINQQEHEGKL